VVVPPLNASVCRFGVFELDLRAAELRKNGVKLRLQDQPYQVLLKLLEHSGEIVSREELRATLWHEDTFVDFETGLNTAIKRLRETLGDSADNPTFIETIPRRGYKFMAPVEIPVSQESNMLDPADRQETPRGKKLLKHGSVVAAVAVVLLICAATWFGVFRVRGKAIDSVAVLPFANASADSDMEYLSDGITDSLISNLSQLPNLRVIARSTVFRYKGKEADPQKVGQDLRVRAVLSGRLLQRGDTLIVQAELMDVAKGSQLWGGRYNRKATDVFALQEDLSKEISEKLRLRLTGEEKQRLTKRYTENAEAYQLCLKGRYYFYKLTPAGLQKAIEYFQQAIDRDPGYALAYAGLADTYNSLAFFTVLPPRELMPKAKAAAAKALEIDDRLAEAHVSLGWAGFTYDRDWSVAGKHLERAVALNPAYPLAHAYYSLYLSALGRSEEALAEAKRARDLDPVSPAIVHYVAVQSYLARQFDQSIEQCQETQAMDPSFTPAYGTMGHAYAAKGMYSEALAAYEKYSALSGGSPGSAAFLGYAHARLGQRQEALRVLDQLKAASKQRYVPAFSFVIVYVGLGEKEQAFTWLEKAYEEHTNSLAYLRVAAIWDPLRSDPRFTDLLHRIGLSQ
jgi:TolB-like protein/DNA-binding winged helix-turn-helix (wHTH) protein/Tfp pilus assembly protein PilF